MLLTQAFSAPSADLIFCEESMFQKNRADSSAENSIFDESYDFLIIELARAHFSAKQFAT